MLDGPAGMLVEFASRITVTGKALEETAVVGQRLCGCGGGPTGECGRVGVGVTRGIVEWLMGGGRGRK